MQHTAQHAQNDAAFCWRKPQRPELDPSVICVFRFLCSGLFEPVVFDKLGGARTRLMFFSKELQRRTLGIGSDTFALNSHTLCSNLQGHLCVKASCLIIPQQEPNVCWTTLCKCSAIPIESNTVLPECRSCAPMNVSISETNIYMCINAVAWLHLCMSGLCKGQLRKCVCASHSLLKSIFVSTTLRGRFSLSSPEPPS